MRYFFFILWKLERFYGKVRFLCSVSQRNMLNLKKFDKGGKLEIGGGETPRLKGLNFINIDIRDIPEVDIIASITDLNELIFPDPVSHIFTRHTLEHLASYELDLALQSLASISTKGTIIEIIVPNIRYHALQYLSSSLNSKDQLHSLAGFNGWQRCLGENYWDVHKSSFDKYILFNELSHYFVFGKYSFVTKDSKHLHFIGEVRSLV